MIRALLSIFLLATGTVAHSNERSTSPGHKQYIPDIVASARPGVSWPVWVAAKVAFDSKGELRADLFSEVDRKIIDSNRNANPSSCLRFLGRVDEAFRPQDSFDDLVQNAVTIISGQVIETGQGFHAGQPGTLLAIRVSSRLKSVGRAADRRILHVFVPEAAIATSRGLVCASSLAGIPAPTAGDRLIAFGYFDVMDQDRSIIAIDPKRHLILDSDGKIHTPQALRAGSEGKTLDDIVVSIRHNPRIRVVPKHEVR